MLRPVESQDIEAIAKIYNHYIEHTVITFEEQAVSCEEMSDRIQEIASVALPWWVACEEHRVVGFAYASKWKGRCAYRYSAESTVYLAPDAVGRGYGTALYGTLFSLLREKSYHVVMGGIALPNAASVALHERLGFEKVAHFREVGYKFERWIDVGYWQLFL
ncbi:N-acetyltransferase family protein [Myxococcota bacterium]|nr:N-acetyltransferase family protein [Myxococcota bacterium]